MTRPPRDRTASWRSLPTSELTSSNAPSSGRLDRTQAVACDDVVAATSHYLCRRLLRSPHRILAETKLNVSLTPCLQRSLSAHQHCARGSYFATRIARQSPQESVWVVQVGDGTPWAGPL